MTSLVDDLNESAGAGCVCRLELCVRKDESRGGFLSMAVYKLDAKMRLHTSPCLGWLFYLANGGKKCCHDRGMRLDCLHYRIAGSRDPLFQGRLPKSQKSLDSGVWHNSTVREMSVWRRMRRHASITGRLRPRFQVAVYLAFSVTWLLAYPTLGEES